LPVTVHFTVLVLVCVNDVCREKEALSTKLNQLNAELSTVTIQRDELEKANLETRLQVLVVAYLQMQCIKAFGLFALFVWIN